MLVLGLFKDLHCFVQVLNLQGARLPFVEVVAEAFAVEHVSDAFELAYLHATTPDSLLLSDDFLLGELVAQVLVLVHDVLRHHHHLHVHALVSTFLPFHESPAQPALMLLNETHLDTVHVMTVMLAVLSPDHEGLVLDITVFEVCLSQSVVLSLGRSLLRETLFLVFKLFTLRYLSFENGTGLLKLHLGVAKSDSVEARLQETISPDTLYVADEGLFASEEFVLPGLFTPVFPGLELAIGHLLSLLLHSVLEGQENSLLERRLRDDLAKHVMLLFHVLRANGGDPFDESLALGTK